MVYSLLQKEEENRGKDCVWVSDACRGLFVYCPCMHSFFELEVRIIFKKTWIDTMPGKAASFLCVCMRRSPPSPYFLKQPNRFDLLCKIQEPYYLGVFRWVSSCLSLSPNVNLRSLPSFYRSVDTQLVFLNTNCTDM